MAAALLAVAAGAQWDAIDSERLALPSGRLERVSGSPAVYIDYAHTPDALSAALSALKALQNDDGNLWVVFGCGGERDQGKRAEMGGIAAAVADKIVITDDNPRGEPASAIRAEILEGAGNAEALGNAETLEIAGREAAIAEVIRQAKANDTVLIAGKGHEDYQEIDGKRLPFSDAAVVTAELKKREKREKRQKRGD